MTTILTGPLPGPRGGSLPHQLAEGNPERVGDQVKVVQPCGLQPQLDAHHSHTGQPGRLRESFLTEPAPLPGMPDPTADNPAPLEQVLGNFAGDHLATLLGP